MSESDETDEVVMASFQTGNRNAISIIFQRYKSRICNFCMRILNSRAEAEDVTGDVFVTLFANKYTFNPKVKFSTWLFTIARNKCISRLRKSNRLVSLSNQRKDNDAGDWQIKSDDVEPDNALATDERSQAVKVALDKLPLEQKEAIVLREYDKFAYDQIAEIMECSLEKVKVLIFRGRENLRAHLSAYIMEEAQ